MSDWNTQNIQLAWFASAVPSVPAAELFATLLASAPEQSSVNRMPTPAMPFLSVASGVIDGLNWVIQVQHGRIDVLASAPDDRPSASVPLLTSEVAAKAKAHIVAQIAAYPDLLPEPNRLSIISVLAQTASSADDACKIANRSAGGVASFDDISDFTLSINRRKTFEFDRSILMNRVLKWETAAFQLLQMPMMQASPIPVPASVSHAALHTLDVNVVPSSRRFGSDEVKKIFGELIVEINRLESGPGLAALGDI